MSGQESDSSEQSEFNPDKHIQIQCSLRTQIEKALSNFKKSPKDRLTYNYIQTKLNILDEYWKCYEKSHKKILRNVEKSYLADDRYMNTYFEVEDTYAVARDTMATKLEELAPARNTSSATVIQQTSNQSEPSPSASAHAQHRLIKLPPIQIPKFDGQYSEWISFHDQFVSLVHNNTTLSNVNKLQLLKQNLVGEAANVLKNTAISENNYDKAWLKLKKRYSNTRVIANSYIQKLFSLRNITQENAQSLKNLLDTSTDCLNGLNGIGVDTQTWDPIVVYLITNKLDYESLKQWEEDVVRECGDQLPTFEMLTNFLEVRFRRLEGIQSKINTRTPRTNPDNKKVFYTAPKEGCVVCSGDHFIFQCKNFVQMPVEDRIAFIERNNLCFNCLIPNHGVKTCRQKTRCRICGRRHHSLIHTETTDPRTPEMDERRDTTTIRKENKTSRDRYTEKNNTTNIASHFATENTQRQTTNVLLATALVKVTVEYGRTLQLRALIDQGSEGSFITESAAQALGLRRNTINGSVSGLGDNTVMQAKHSVSFDLQSNYDKTFKLPVNAYVLKSLTRLLPSKQTNMTWKHLQGLSLADPEYGKPAQIDLLLGAEVYSRIMLDGIVSGSQGSPLAQRTSLGWILSGAINSTFNQHNNHHVINMHITTHEEDLDQLQRFWEIESEDIYNNKKRMTEEEMKCEQTYAETYTRDTEGRYIVEIPLKDKDFDFGNTRQIAERRLEQLERRLNKDKNLKEEYTRVLMEYSELQHMEEINDKEKDTKGKFYMPHHAVVRQDKSTSKVRIVFDASCKGPNGKSLNDNMMVGPKLQLDLRHLVMKWRRHQIAIIADCVKMYRQIKVTEESANYQRILWRVNGELKEFRMVRVTFGTASAPYLATKTLQQLAVDEEQRFPKASHIARSDFYMDDLLSGVDNLEDAQELYTEMTHLMGSGGFELQKWASNNKDFEEYVEREKSKADESYLIKSDEIVKTLGIAWNKNTDTFQYRINLPQTTKTVTKRLILSEISRLFDPIGWLAPVIITAKVMIQKLWLSRVSWDEEVPENIRREWIQFCKELEQAKNINIDRWLQTNTNDKQLELHGYSDASQMAYAAVVYLRTVKENGEIHVKLITAKTRVAPIKTISVPRLELCGAVLLSKLLKEVAQHLNIQQKDIHAYTDSSIVLAWLQCHPTKWKTFVANRTSEILNILPASCWSHVETDKNPADVASRGASPAEILTHHLWWTGPSNLMKEEIKYEQPKQNLTDLEMKKEKVKTKIKTMTNTITENKEDFDLLRRYSNVVKLYRVTAYLLRTFKKEKPKEIHLTGKEINEARERCIKMSQEESFQEEIERLTNGKNVKKSSKIRTLNPFLDAKGVLRVGGRIHNSNLPDHSKHQIILAQNHPFSKLILTEYHLQTFHGGPTLMLSNLRRRYWILHAKSLVKQIVHKCVKCVRFRAATSKQMMGSLPASRVTPSKPFLNSGVDFAGPIDLRLSKGRGCKTQKGYLAIFVCMVTRAIHIEIVTSLNTQDFIAAFKRFVARRGHCSDMWSDNATNLTSGNKELKIMFNKSQDNLQSDIENILANDGTTWHHIPASAPHFGGLWEAGVKSIKFHLKRVLGNTTLTYEEMSTVTCQIEACLNSRPISPMSDDPTDLLPLTPGHFLVGESPTVVPEESYLESNINRLTRWQYTQRMLQDFWSRWSKEYLSRLQQRPKWMTKQPNIKTGDLVLIKDDNLPPSKWSLGRILDVHPGVDNLVRVVTVKCKNTIVKRPITKVCCLPVDLTE